MKMLKLSQRGQIVIPAGVRKELDLSSGSELALEVREGKIILFPREKIIEEKRKNALSKLQNFHKKFKDELKKKTNSVKLVQEQRR